MSQPDTRIQELHLTLPPVPKPIAKYGASSASRPPKPGSLKSDKMTWGSNALSASVKFRAVSTCLTAMRVRFLKSNLANARSPCSARQSARTANWPGPPLSRPESGPSKRSAPARRSRAVCGHATARDRRREAADGRPPSRYAAAVPSRADH